MDEAVVSDAAILAWDAFIEQLADEGFHSHVPQTDDELWEYVNSEYGYAIPRVPVCENHTAPFIALADSFFGRVNDCIWIGPRTGGKTLQFAILDHLLFYHFDCTIANVGAIDIQAQKCYQYFESFATKPQFKDKLLKAPMLSRTYGTNGGMVEIMPATMNRVNSPHPNRAHLDEVELMLPKVLEEAKSMPNSQGDRAPATIWTSSRKKAHGPMEALLADAPSKGIPVSKWCVFEIIEQCPPERHLEGVGCVTCPLHDICKEKLVHPDGSTEFKQGPGRAARARGWMRIDDVAAKYRSIDWGVFRAQWLSERPETSGLAYPMFDEDVHIIDYTYHPAFPVVCGIDFGFTNPNVALFIQATENDDLVVFAEHYKWQETATEFALSLKTDPWFEKTSWRVADSANRGDRETLIAYGVDNVPIQKAGTPMDKSSVINGINLVRYLLKPAGRRPILYFAKNVANCIREIKAYHHPDSRNEKNAEELPAKMDDHAMDALRYAVMELFKGQIVT